MLTCLARLLVLLQHCTGKGISIQHEQRIDDPPTCVMVPAFHRHLELCGHHAQQGRKWRIIDAQEDARESQVAKLHGEAQSIRGAATLTDHRQVGFVERVVPYQFVFGIW